MIVCLCNNITDKDIKRAVDSGLVDCDRFVNKAQCTHSCGTCTPDMKAIFKALAKNSQEALARA